VVTHQLQVERRTAKAHRPKTNALPLDHATNTNNTRFYRQDGLPVTQSAVSDQLKETEGTDPDQENHALASSFL